MIRLQDIAERAQVSIMTVSKSLRDAPDISAATKDRIRRLASKWVMCPTVPRKGFATAEHSCLA